MFIAKSHKPLNADIELGEKANRSKSEAEPGRLNPLWHRLATLGGNPAEQGAGVSNPRIQTKLTIGPPDDPYEQEADRVADQVMRMPDPAIRRKPT